MVGSEFWVSDPLLEYWKSTSPSNELLAWASDELRSKRADPKARRVLADAAAGGDTFAMCRLSAHYCNESGIDYSPGEAFLLASQAAKADFAPGHFLLAWCYEHGIGVANDLDLARKHYEVAAERGFGVAATRIANGLIEGRFGSNDYERATELLSLAATGGDATAAMQLAQWYEEGVGVERNEALALRWYEFASERGNSLASLRLGMAYLGGELGVAVDREKANCYIERSERGTPP